MQFGTLRLCACRASSGCTTLCRAARGWCRWRRRRPTARASAASTCSSRCRCPATTWAGTCRCVRPRRLGLSLGGVPEDWHTMVVSCGRVRGASGPGNGLGWGLQVRPPRVRWLKCWKGTVSWQATVVHVGRACRASVPLTIGGSRQLRASGCLWRAQHYAVCSFYTAGPAVARRLIPAHAAACSFATSAN